MELELLRLCQEIKKTRKPDLKADEAGALKEPLEPQVVQAVSCLEALQEGRKEKRLEAVHLVQQEDQALHQRQEAGLRVRLVVRKRLKRL